MPYKITSVSIERKQDAWLVRDGYIEREYYTYITFPIDVTWTCTFTPPPSSDKQDSWLARGGYL